MEASANAGPMWWEEPVTGVLLARLDSAPVDADLVSVICKDLSVPSVIPLLASASVSTVYTHDSVIGVYQATGAFRAASPASVMAMLRTATL